MEMVTSDLSEPAYQLVLKLWQTVFGPNLNSPELRKAFLLSRDRLVHTTINRFDYENYRMIRDTTPADVKLSWADTVAETLQLSLENNHIFCEKPEIFRYLRGTAPISDKRSLIGTYLRNCLLRGNLKVNFEDIMRNFVDFCDAVGDPLYFTTPEHSAYMPGFRLITRLIPELTPYEILLIIEDVAGNQLRDFIVSLMRAADPNNDAFIMSCWHHIESSATSSDLTTAMWSLFRAKRTDECMQLYKKYPELHDENQIEIFLAISQSNRDWPHLQQQFEDMYGQKELPYVVHYAGVMNSLVSIGLTNEVEKLYYQLQKRHLTPNADIYKAMIRSALHKHDYEKAQSLLSQAMEDVKMGRLDKKTLPKLQGVIFRIHFLSGSVEAAAQAFRQVVEKQMSSDVPLIDSKLMSDFLKFTADTYSLKDLNLILQMGEQLDLQSEEYYYNAIKALTQLGEFQRANDMVLEAHANCRPPYQSSMIYAAQIRLYRLWLSQVTDKDLRSFLSRRMIDLMRKKTQSQRGLAAYYRECINFMLFVDNEAQAQRYLSYAERDGCLEELLMIPFLRYFSERGSTNKVLETYRKMVNRKLTTSAKTYVWLIRALLKVDKEQGRGLDSSYKLLQSVFDLYGFSAFDAHTTSTTPLDEVRDNAVELLKIATAYAEAAPAKDPISMEMVLNFLTQMKERLNGRIGFSFRYSILLEMSKLYLIRGNTESASQLIDNAMKECHDLIDNYRSTLDYPDAYQVPKKLLLDYRHAFSAKIKLLEKTNASTDEYVSVLKQAVTRNARVDPILLNKLCGKILEENKLENIRLCLDMCDRFLIPGNFSELKTEKSFQFFYKLALFCLLTRYTITPKDLMEEFKILSEYYSVYDFETVKTEFKDISHPFFHLKQSLPSLSRRTKQTYTPTFLLNNIGIVFNPETIPHLTKNRLLPRLAKQLVRCIEECVGDNKEIAFKLYKDYQDTMDYLLYFKEYHLRRLAFKKAIDRINPPSIDLNEETQESRKKRTLEVLQHVGHNLG